MTLPKSMPKGAAHGGWKGEAVGQWAGYNRCRNLYPAPLGPCENTGCTREATERHHRDGDTRHNDRSNVQFLCRGCHMTVDGRGRAQTQKMKRAVSRETRSPETQARMRVAARARWANGAYEHLRGPKAATRQSWED